MSTALVDDEVWLSRPKAAEILGIPSNSVGAIERYLVARRMPGRHVRYAKSSVIAFLSRCTKSGEQVPEPAVKNSKNSPTEASS